MSINLHQASNGAVIGVWDFAEKPTFLVKLFLFEIIEENLKK